MLNSRQNIVKSLKQRETLTKNTINKQLVYKVFYDFKDIKNPNFGVKCIFKDFFVSSISNKLNFDITTIFYYEDKCNKKTINIDKSKYKTKNKTLDNLLDDLKTFDINFNTNLNNIYIADDLETLYFIQDDCLNLFTIFNFNEDIKNILDNLPAILTDNKTISLNRNVLSEYSTLKYKANDVVYSQNSIQLFKFKDNFEIEKEFKDENTQFVIHSPGDNWYFTTFSLKSDPKHIILQLIYITDTDINKYNKFFSDYKIPFNFELYKRNGGRRLLKIY